MIESQNFFGEKIMKLRKLSKLFGLSSLNDYTTKVFNSNFKKDEEKFVEKFKVCCDAGKYFCCDEQQSIKHINSVDSAVKLFKEMLNECNIKYKCSRNSKSNYFVLENPLEEKYDRIGDFCIKKPMNNYSHSMMRMIASKDDKIACDYVSYFDYLECVSSGCSNYDHGYVLSFEEKCDHISNVFFVFNLSDCKFDEVNDNLISKLEITKFYNNNLNNKKIIVENTDIKKFKIKNHVYYHYKLPNTNLKKTNNIYMRIWLNTNSVNYDNIIDISAIGELIFFNSWTHNDKEKIYEDRNLNIKSNINKTFNTSDTIEQKFSDGYSTKKINDDEIEILLNPAHKYIKAIHFEKKPNKIINIINGFYIQIYDNIIINAIATIYNNTNFSFVLPFYNANLGENTLFLDKLEQNKIILSYDNEIENNNVKFAIETYDDFIDKIHGSLEKYEFYLHSLFLHSYCSMKDEINKNKNIFYCNVWSDNCDENITQKTVDFAENLYYLPFQPNNLEDLICNNLDFENEVQIVKYGKYIYYIIKIILHKNNKINLKKPKYGKYFCECNKNIMN